MGRPDTVSKRPSLTATELDNMRRYAIAARHAFEDGGEVDDGDVARLTRAVEVLVDEIDRLVWRATVATMALDGRVAPDEVVLG